MRFSYLSGVVDIVQPTELCNPAGTKYALNEITPFTSPFTFRGLKHRKCDMFVHRFVI